MNRLQKIGVIGLLLVGSGSVYYIGSNKSTTVNPQPENLEIELTPTDEDTNPSITDEDTNRSIFIEYDDTLELITTEEGREARRSELLSAIIEVYRREVEERGGFYNFFTSDDTDLVRSQIMRNARGVFNIDLEIIESHAKQYENMVDEIMPADTRGMSIEDLKTLRYSLRSLYSDYINFMDDQADLLPGMYKESYFSHGLESFLWKNIVDEVERGFIIDVFEDMSAITDEERREVSGIESNDELFNVVSRMVRERVESADPFDFIPYQRRFLERHNLDIEITRNRRDVGDMISFMLWVYRKPLRDRALEGVSQEDPEWDSIDARFSKFQPESGWKIRTESLMEVEGNLVAEFIEEYDSYSKERDKLINRLEEYREVIRLARLEHKDFTKRLMSNIDYMYRRYGKYPEISYAKSLRDKINDYIEEVHEEIIRLKELDE